MKILEQWKRLDFSFDNRIQFRVKSIAFFFILTTNDMALEFALIKLAWIEVWHMQEASLIDIVRRLNISIWIHKLFRYDLINEAPAPSTPPLHEIPLSYAARPVMFVAILAIGLVVRLQSEFIHAYM